MTFEMKIHCDNEAFEVDPVAEVQRILAEVSTKLRDASEMWQTVHDVNGNRVGS